jgi:predicted outer membrane protein
MEIRFLKMLEKIGYDDPDFWLNLNLGFQLNSIVWLKNGGKTELKKAWGMYQLVKKQNKDLDEKKKEEIIAKMESIKNLAKPAAIESEAKSEKKQTLLEWLDVDNGSNNWI